MIVMQSDGNVSLFR